MLAFFDTPDRAMQYKDYYQILGVARQASTDDIRMAYRRLARKYHPDVSTLPDAEARFKEITEAYDALKDPRRRAAYDRLLQERDSKREARPDVQPPPRTRRAETTEQATTTSFSEFIQNLFSGRRSRATDDGKERRQRAAGADQHASITISLEEAYHGTQRTVTIPAPTKSARASAQARTLNVKIPPGVQAGQQIRLAGLGAPGRGGGNRGDFYLKVEIAPHWLFRLDGKDVHLELPIAPWEAALGASVQVPTLGGPVELRVPAGSQSGRKLRLKGRGLPGDPPGDQYVQLQIVTPPADHLQLRNLYEQLRLQSGFNPRADFG